MYLSTDQCSEGMYRNSDGDCVSQCPCGYYGDARSRVCDEGAVSYLISCLLLHAILLKFNGLQLM